MGGTTNAIIGQSGVSNTADITQIGNSNQRAPAPDRRHEFGSRKAVRAFQLAGDLSVQPMMEV
ncbi:hypothetical protein [Bradyrhizobium sp. 195]|uniref:hypothetical protein n=1 Tax=Bradyrhizobium sp. 195 TaxID=2782662 RepID=UPI002001A374|nr:hypothetical protein [Bradyrhizobium sp. 195]